MNNGIVDLTCEALAFIAEYLNNGQNVPVASHVVLLYLLVEFRERLGQIVPDIYTYTHKDLENDLEKMVGLNPNAPLLMDWERCEDDAHNGFYNYMLNISV